MGASNFARCNTSKYFVVLTNVDEKFSECSECGNKHWEWEENYVEEGDKDCPDCDNKDCITHGEESRSPEEWEINDFKSNVIESLSQLSEYRSGGADDPDRNYYGHCLGTLYDSKVFGDVEVGLEIRCMLYSAYYEGATLDFIAEVQVDGYEHDDNVDIAYASDMNAGMVTIQNRNAQKYVDNLKVKLVNKLEEVYAQFSDKYDRLGGFSDGTSIYTKSE